MEVSFVPYLYHSTQAELYSRCPVRSRAEIRWLTTSDDVRLEEEGGWCRDPLQITEIPLVWNVLRHVDEEIVVEPFAANNLIVSASCQCIPVSTHRHSPPYISNRASNRSSVFRSNRKHTCSALLLLVVNDLHHHVCNTLHRNRRHRHKIVCVSYRVSTSPQCLWPVYNRRASSSFVGYHMLR